VSGHPQRAAGNRERSPRNAGSSDAERGDPRWRLLRWIPALVYAGFIGADALVHGYFDTDDFHNIYWAATGPVLRRVVGAVLPWPPLFRPAGLLVYRIVSKAADLDPVPYHAVLLLFHAANVVLVYQVARRAASSERVGAFASSLYLLPVAFISTFWKFGEIFDLLSTVFFLLAFWAFLALPDGWRKTFLVVLSFMIACRAKEMAITLPAVLVSYDVFMGEGRLRRHLAMHATLVTLAIVFAAGFRPAAALPSTAPYHLDIRLGALIENGGWYARALWGASPGSAKSFVILCIGVLAITLACRDRLLGFAASFVPITLLPVIFLTNHRFAFYWYAPSLGVWLWLGRLAEIAGNRLRAPALRRAAEPAMYLACLLGILAGGATARRTALRLQRQEAANFRGEAESVARPCSADPTAAHPDFFRREPLDSARIIYQVVCGDRNLEFRRK
jgi:hypothetical protein